MEISKKTEKISACLKKIKMTITNENEPQSRRHFFSKVLKKTGGITINEVERQAEKVAKRYVRPPGASTELDFLSHCTRCGECIPACPHGTIFPLGAHTGVAVNTPALDLINKACHLCDDFPCVSACETDALNLILKEDLKFAKVEINTSTCLPYLGPECGVCISVCPVPGAITVNLTTPEIDQKICIGCAICREACMVSPSAINMIPNM